MKLDPSIAKKRRELEQKRHEWLLDQAVREACKRGRSVSHVYARFVKV